MKNGMASSVKPVVATYMRWAIIGRTKGIAQQNECSGCGQPHRRENRHAQQDQAHQHRENCQGQHVPFSIPVRVSFQMRSLFGFLDHLEERLDVLLAGVFGDGFIGRVPSVP